MNKFNNPRLTNTTVSGTGVKHPMRPHVILGDPENGFIRGDLLDANAVIKLIKNAAKAIGALEELEQSNWIDDNATTEEPAGVLQPGEVGFKKVDDNNLLAYNDQGSLNPVVYPSGSTSKLMIINDPKAFGKTVLEAYSAGFLTLGDDYAGEKPSKSYAEVQSSIIRKATVSI